jgi:hypothetical protein
VQLSSEWLHKQEFSRWTLENSIPPCYCIVDAVPTVVRVLAGDITQWEDWVKVSKLIESASSEFDIEKKSLPSLEGYTAVTGEAMKQV